MSEIYRLASVLRERHRARDVQATFTHVPSIVDAARALALLRASSLSSLIAEDGAPLTHPEQPWYGPISLITADPLALREAGVTASTWEPPAWRTRAAELVVWMYYVNAGATAQQRLTLHASAADVSISRNFYDNQRAGTGYEGDDWISIEPTQGQIDDFLAIVREMTGIE